MLKIVVSHNCEQQACTSINFFSLRSGFILQVNHKLVSLCKTGELFQTYSSESELRSSAFFEKVKKMTNISTLPFDSLKEFLKEMISYIRSTSGLDTWHIELRLKKVEDFLTLDFSSQSKVECDIQKGNLNYLISNLLEFVCWELQKQFNDCLPYLPGTILICSEHKKRKYKDISLEAHKDLKNTLQQLKDRF